MRFRFRRRAGAAVATVRLIARASFLGALDLIRREGQRSLLDKTVSIEIPRSDLVDLRPAEAQLKTLRAWLEIANELGLKGYKLKRFDRDDYSTSIELNVHGTPEL